MSIATTETKNAEPAGAQPDVQPRPTPNNHIIRYTMKITIEGIMLLIVILLLGFAAWHSGTNLLYLIFSVLVAFYLVHGFILAVNLSSLTLSTTVPDTVTAGRPFDVTVTISNAKRYAPSYAIRLLHKTAESSGAMGSIFFPFIPKNQSRDGFYTTRTPRRGLHTISTTSISTRYPFGFEERTQVRREGDQFLALPPTYGVSTIAAEIPFGFGDQESSVRGTGTDLYGLREYVPGEHARHIHWRASARAQKLILAEYTREERRQLMLMLDNGAPQTQHSAISAEFENAVILTASLARHLIDSGYEIGLVTADGLLPVGQGSSHLLAIMRHLALVELSEPKLLPSPDEAIVQITYQLQNGDINSGIGNGHLEIDSRAWTPPNELNSQGDNRL